MSCFSTCVSGFGAAIALLAFIFDLAFFFIAKSRINSVSGGSATMGNAIWLTLAAWLLLFFSGCFYGLGRCCIRRRPRDAFNKRENSDRWNPPAGGNGAYDDPLRLDAVKAEADRKARQKQGEQGLPAFQEYDPTQPLTHGGDDEHPSLHYQDAAPGAGQQGYAGGYARAAEGTRAVDEYYAPSNQQANSYPPQPRRQATGGSAHTHTTSGYAPSQVAYVQGTSITSSPPPVPPVANTGYLAAGGQYDHAQYPSQVAQYDHGQYASQNTQYGDDQYGNNPYGSNAGASTCKHSLAAFVAMLLIDTLQTTTSLRRTRSTPHPLPTPTLTTPTHNRKNQSSTPTPTTTPASSTQPRAPPTPNRAPTFPNRRQYSRHHSQRSSQHAATRSAAAGTAAAPSPTWATSTPRRRRTCRMRAARRRRRWSTRTWATRWARRAPGAHGRSRRARWMGGATTTVRRCTTRRLRSLRVSGARSGDRAGPGRPWRVTGGRTFFLYAALYDCGGYLAASEGHPARERVRTYCVHWYLLFCPHLVLLSVFSFFAFRIYFVICNGLCSLSLLASGRATSTTI